MEALRFKKDIKFETGKTYSVCLRGARRISTDDEFNLSLYTPTYCEKPNAIAQIVTQQNF